MRALAIRPDDEELFQNAPGPENCAFFISHLPAFKRMWTEEGKVYWLRFLLTFKSYFENTFMKRPEYRILLECLNDEVVHNFVFINIHKKFVRNSYSATKTFAENIFLVAKHTINTREPNRIKNSFYAKESRKAFEDLFGKPKVDEDIPTVPITYLSTIYSMFMGSVCTLLKRWLKEPDLPEGAEKYVDFIYPYWKPEPEWADPIFWPMCFEKHLADNYKNALPKMLMTLRVHRIFVIHDPACSCDYHEGDSKKIYIFPLLINMRYMNIFPDPPVDVDVPFCMTQVGYLQPDVLECASHSNCYHKILHDPKCPQPYLCAGSSICVLTCEKNQKKLQIASQTVNFWEKVFAETFTCKAKNKRHVSTSVESDNTQIETFAHHQQEGWRSRNLKDEHTEEFMTNMCGDSKLLNSFNQHNQKEEFKNKLETKLHQKYSFDAGDFSDSSYCVSLFENARKVWLMSSSDKNHKLNNAEESVLTSAQTTVAVGTNSVLTGRIVLPSPKFCTLSTRECEKVTQELPVPVPNESKDKPESKQSKKKQNANVPNENNNGPSTSTNMPTVNEAKVTPVQLPETNKVDLPKNPPSSSAEKQQNTQSNEIPIKVNNVQHKNTSETSGKDYPVIVKQTTLVNASKKVSPTVILQGVSPTTNNPEDNKIVEDFLTLMGVLEKPSTSEEVVEPVSVSQTTNPEQNADVKDEKWKTCAFCGGKEIACKTFKRCARCKADKFTKQRYYCSRQCQVDDWQKSHRDEHLKKT